MDIFPQTQQAAYALRAFDATNKNKKLKCAIDVQHRCSSDCKYWICTKSHVAVCTKSRHTHFCNENCSLQVQENDGTYCSITGFAVKGPELLVFQNKAKRIYGKNVSNQHWATKKKRNTKSAKSLRYSRVNSILKLIFLSNERRKITKDSIGKATRIAKFEIKSISVTSYATAMAIFEEAYDSIRSPPMSISPELSAYLVTVIGIIRSESERRNMKLKRTDQTIVLGLLQLLETGFQVNGATLIEPSPFVQTYGLSLHQFGKLKGIRCRQQTIATRQIKQALVTTDGHPLIRLPKCPV